jgi:hypothetical protein
VSHLTREDRLRLRAEAVMIRMRMTQLEGQLTLHVLETLEWEIATPRIWRWWGHRRRRRRAADLCRAVHAQMRRLAAILEAFPRA